VVQPESALSIVCRCCSIGVACGAIVCALTLVRTAHAQEHCPYDQGCCRTVPAEGYPTTGAASLSRWTPVVRIRDPSPYATDDGSGLPDLVVTNRGSGVPDSGFLFEGNCGAILVRTAPLDASTTYQVTEPWGGTTTFTTSADDSQPEFTVEIGEDLDPGTALRLPVHATRPIAAVEVAAGIEWHDVYRPLATDWELTSDSNWVGLNFVSTEGLQVFTSATGIAPAPPQDEPSGCSCSVAPSSHGRWSAAAAALALAATLRRRLRPGCRSRSTR
jgi:MYXO-CTERM domain-containing protein